MTSQIVSASELPALPLVFDNNAQGIVKNFRDIRNDIFISNRIEDNYPSIEGLENINASASGQFSENQLTHIISLMPRNKNIILIDLRRESHGFINGIAISWYGKVNWANKDKTIQEIIEDENSKLTLLKHKENTEIFTILKKDKGIITELSSTIFPIQSAISEEELAHKYGLSYKRWYVNDRMIPDDETIEEYINFIRNLDENDWLHVHCRAGGGRTTSFLAIYDIIKNAGKVSLDDILARQYMLGGINLNVTNKQDKIESLWKKSLGIERYEFLQKFYLYMKNNNLHISWKNWKTQSN